MLSCTCNSEFDESDWYYEQPNDFFILNTVRARRCRSCNAVIIPGDECIKFERTREPKDDIEERIYGDGWDAVPLAAWYQCAKCGEMYLNLSALGYCINPDDNVMTLLYEYHGLTGFKRREANHEY